MEKRTCFYFMILVFLFTGCKEKQETELFKAVEGYVKIREEKNEIVKEVILVYDSRNQFYTIPEGCYSLSLSIDFRIAGIKDHGLFEFYFIGRRKSGIDEGNYNYIPEESLSGYSEYPVHSFMHGSFFDWKIQKWQKIQSGTMSVKRKITSQERVLYEININAVTDRGDPFVLYYKGLIGYASIKK